MLADERFSKSSHSHPTSTVCLSQGRISRFAGLYEYESSITLLSSQEMRAEDNVDVLNFVNLTFGLPYRCTRSDL